jgi:hypothetical protein
MATATQRRAVADQVIGNGIVGSVKNLCATVELAASASGTTIDFGYIPAGARIIGASRLYNDDLATSGSPTLDLGLIAVDGNITSDPDAINDGISLSAAGNDVLVVKDAANLGLPAWDLVADETANPGGSLLVRGVVKDAATTATGTITLDLYYIVD